MHKWVSVIYAQVYHVFIYILCDTQTEGGQLTKRQLGEGNTSRKINVIHNPLHVNHQSSINSLKQT